MPGGGIFSTAVGYAGGYTPNPTYKDRVSALAFYLFGGFTFFLNQTVADPQPQSNQFLIVHFARKRALVAPGTRRRFR